METPVQIDFQGMDAKPDVRVAIEKHVTQLEERFGRIIAGRVVLRRRAAAIAPAAFTRSAFACRCLMAARSISATYVRTMSASPT